MIIHRIRGFEQYQTHVERNRSALERHERFLLRHVPAHPGPFTVPGYSYTAGKQVQFLVDYEHSGDSGRVIWRESVRCPQTHFNNRIRATFHLFDVEMESYPDSSIYITEQITPIHDYFASRFANLTGSEFLGDRVPCGAVNADGVRNENLCELSFPDACFDQLISLDVLEHIPDYTLALRECSRVLKPGGRMMWSAPFVPNCHEHFVRARIENGAVVHLMEPEYHGDPLSSDGLLCFRHYGWKILQEMREAGFRDAYAACYQSAEFGYLGSEQFMFVAVK